MEGKTSWHSNDDSGNDTRIVLFYKKCNFCHLLPFAKVGQNAYSPKPLVLSMPDEPSFHTLWEDSCPQSRPARRCHRYGGRWNRPPRSTLRWGYKHGIGEPCTTTHRGTNRRNDCRCCHCRRRTYWICVHCGSPNHSLKEDKFNDLFICVSSKKNIYIKWIFTLFITDVTPWVGTSVITSLGWILRFH